MRPLDLQGKQFGRLMAHSCRTSPKGRLWFCTCSCGNSVEVVTGNLTMGHTKSCGCLKAEIIRSVRVTHGKSNSKAYRCWRKMKNRCMDSSDPAFCNYGGRGITVSASWLKFDNFYSDMGDPPEGTSIERVDNDLGYSKENVVWASRIEQSRNKRNTLKVVVEGKIMPVSKVAEVTGIPYKTLYARLKVLNKTIDEALAMGHRRQVRKEDTK